MRPVENDILHEETNVSKENMVSYADIVKDTVKRMKIQTQTQKVIHPVKRSNQSFFKTRMMLVHL
jgi:hypothetical protein